MRRYVIYALVYGTIGICVGVAMAYVTKDTTVIGGIHLPVFERGPKGIKLSPIRVVKPQPNTAPSDEGEPLPPSLEELAE